MRKLTSSHALALLLAGAAGPAAMADIPRETGWSGSVNIGAGVGQSETNMLAGLSSIDLGDERIDSLDEDAGSEDIAFPALQFDINYTLGDSQTQFYLRNQPSPYVLLDMEALAGIRQQVPRIGIVDLALSATTIPTDIWKDPYLTGADRGDTERTTSGLHMAWRGVMDTALTLEFSSKEVEIDDEDSGESLGLSFSELQLLERTGEVYRFHGEYPFQIGEKHRLIPGLTWLDYDLDGGAMAEDGVAAQLLYQYTSGRWGFNGRVQVQALEAKEDNPIYATSADRDVISIAAGVSYARPFGLDSWTANARAAWLDSDSDIDFYDESLVFVSVGMLYRID